MPLSLGPPIQQLRVVEKYRIWCHLLFGMSLRNLLSIYVIYLFIYVIYLRMSHILSMNIKSVVWTLQNINNFTR